ncbi:uncharacterized protein TNCV_1018311 [Trichonephila clavipes]|nr:uncharacterized protein TNCV_1018311 [Trichonephila clavipes]
MPRSAIEDLLKKWEAVRAMVLEWHPNQADVSTVGDLYNDNAINYFRKILKKRENYEAQWLSGSVSLFHATGPGFKSRGEQGQLSISSLQWVDK